MDKRKIIPVLILSLVSVIVGLIITLGTFVLVGLQAKHLPGGSLGAGLVFGANFPWRGSTPRWLCGLLGAGAGVVGWTIGALFL